MHNHPAKAQRIDDGYEKVVFSALSISTKEFQNYK